MAGSPPPPSGQARLDLLQMRDLRACVANQSTRRRWLMSASELAYLWAVGRPPRAHTPDMANVRPRTEDSDNTFPLGHLWESHQQAVPLQVRMRTVFYGDFGDRNRHHTRKLLLYGEGSAEWTSTAALPQVLPVVPLRIFPSANLARYCTTPDKMLRRMKKKNPPTSGARINNLTSPNNPRTSRPRNDRPQRPPRPFPVFLPPAPTASFGGASTEGGTSSPPPPSC